MLTIKFEMYVEQNGKLVKKTFEASYRIVGGQNGGRDEPSWDEYADLYYVRDLSGEEVEDPEVLAEAEKAVEKAYEDMIEDASFGW